MNKNELKQTKHSIGYSLIELMLSITLGLVITVNVLGIFVSSKASFKIQNGLATIQENGRMLQQYLTKIVRLVGNMGCNNLAVDVPEIYANGLSANFSFNSGSNLMGYYYNSGSSTWVPTLPSWLGTGIKTGTDVVVVNYASPNQVNLSSAMTTQASNIVVPARFTIANNDVLMISDCERTTIFKTNAVANSAGTYTISHTTATNSTANVSKVYNTDAQVGKVFSYAFYVKDTGALNQAGNRIYGLYTRDINLTEQLIVQGIESMLITYGVDTDGDGVVDDYSNASTVNSSNLWGNVRVIRIMALVSSIEPAAETPQNYTFNGTTVTPTDLLIRRQWDIYLDLRNRQ